MKTIWLCFLWMLFVSKCNCQDKVPSETERIIIQPGIPFGKKQFTFFVQLLFKDNPKRYGRSFQCGGSLYKKTYVITMASCLAYAAGNDTKKIEEKLIKQKNLEIYGETELGEGPDATKFEPETIHLHPKYKYLGSKFSDGVNDIAVIKVKNTSIISPFITSVNLPSGASAKRCDEGTTPGHLFTAKCDLLQYVILKVQTAENLKKTYKKCTLEKEHFYSEKGLSVAYGAPYICYEKTKGSTEPIQYGVHLFLVEDKSCQKIFNTFEDIRMHLTFINQHTVVQKIKKRARFSGLRSNSKKNCIDVAVIIYLIHTFIL